MILKNDYIVNFVFPILTVKEIESNKYTFEQLLGTGFLIGKRGYALTASHIFYNLNGKNLITLFIDNGKWIMCPIVSIENHPTEDLSIIKLRGDEWKSPFRISVDWQGGWKDYLTCGYPMDVAYENIVDSPMGKIISPRPEMVHTRGYIRRIVNRNLEIENVKGENFYELSTLAGKGYSGGPIFYVTPENIWDIMGIYVAEKENVKFDKISEKEEIHYVYPSLAYAVKSEAFAHWSPNILGKTVIEESQDFFI